MNNHIGFNLIRWCLIRYFLQLWYVACNIFAIFVWPFYFEICFWITQDAHWNLAKIGQNFSFANFDVWEILFLWSVSVPKQPPLKLKSACNEIAEDCWTQFRLVLRGGKLLEEETSAFFLAEVMASGFRMVSAISTRIQCRMDMIVF